MLEKVSHIGVHIVHHNSTFSRYVTNCNVEKYFNFQAFKHLFPFKDAFLNNIGIYYLWQFRPETFSLGCASLHEDYYMQCPVF